MNAEQERQWEREALRLCERYLREVVLAFELCPWAEPALRGERVGRAVCLAPSPAPTDCLAFLDRWTVASAPDVEIGLLLFPRYIGGTAAFDGFAERVRRADQARGSAPPPAVAPALQGSGLPRYLVAAFHPGGASSFVGANQMVSFLRRTPDPMLQFVRADLIDGLRAAQPDVSEIIARRNHQAMMARAAGELGDAGDRASPPLRHAHLNLVIGDIHADRAATYARLSGADSA